MSMFHELMMRKKEQIMYATIKGTLTENDGVFSGFSASNYLALQQPFKLNADTVAEFKVKINLTSNTILSGIIGTPNSYGMNFVSANDSKLTLYFGNGSSWNVLNAKKGTTILQSNTDYYIRLLINKGNITLLLSTDDITYTTEFTTVVTISEEYIYDLSFGRARGTDQYMHGSIDLPNSYIKLGSTKYNLQAVVGYTIVGNPTIVDGVVSGFTTSDYLTISQSSGTVNSIEIITKVQDIASTITHTGLIIGLNGNLNLRLAIGTNGRVQANYRDVNNTTKYLSSSKQASEYNYIRVMLNTTGASLDVSTDGITWINEYTRTEIPNLENAFTSCSMGYLSNTYNSFEGSINMPKTSIKLNNKLWFNGQEG